MASTYEIRMHGIGGQGVAAAADLLGLAAVRDHHWAHSFPFFGTAIRGGAVTAFTRISTEPIHTRSFIYNPDMVVVFADYLLCPEYMEGLKEDSILLVNTSHSEKELPALPIGRLKTIDADGIIRSIPGCRIANGPILGAFIALSNQVSLESVEASINERFPTGIANVTIQATRAGYQAARENRG